MHDLGTLGGTNSNGSGINASGEVSGSSVLSGNLITHAFLYDRTTMHDLGTLGGNYSAADGLNDAGEVGLAKTASADLHAFLYDGMTAYDLNNLLSNPILGLSLTEATAINNLGQIVAYGSDAICGGTCTYLLTPGRQNPTPEPRFYGIILCGLLGAIGLRYRHRVA